METPVELKYSEQHVWVRVENGRAVIGVTDFAQEEFGDIVYAELPELNDELQAGEPFGSVESIKSVTELYAPVSGTVVQINRALLDNPGIINLSPYERGWMAIVELAAPEQLNELWDAQRYNDSYGHE
ncbi:glycine cleavage system protein GcvH [Paenibacillus cymbidii]|uniref:glycine cleavage system protein GcvH n=1 Tax=Paenibacillus cymbidii TaxID=1639034 RepID=UPI001080B8B1|nr:glycine cleavage system protein GcvH [Paenibacillus cymbidii]